VPADEQLLLHPRRLQRGGPEVVRRRKDLDEADPDQPRVPAGQGRESGQWTSDDASGLAPGGPEAFAGDGADASIILVSNEKERNYEEGRARGEESPKEDIEHDRPIPLYPEGPLALPPPAAGAVHREPSPKVDPNKLHHIFDKQGRVDEFLLRCDSQEAAFGANEDATRTAITEQKITGQYKIQIEVDGYTLGVGGKVMPDGTTKIGTAYPWKDKQS